MGMILFAGLLIPLGIGTLFTLIGGLLLTFNVVSYLRSGSQTDPDALSQG